ncbi:hypothetical protein TPB0596_42500 [Tsukamurella pulmonis]|uniref:hypothetical protein n=1 Tax=Tsukamurella pulmonis TaxID=47312 RepID=UPI001EDEDCE7|nr:hypothetical protein [Tsukamurella pulmonis]BDD84487.1 hypothetical protein TPB0596_42500 [Tsukamurella pulmonis]
MAADQPKARHLHGPFDAWANYLEEAMNLVELTYSGLSSMDFRIELERALDPNVDETTNKFKTLQRRAQDAHREIDAGYPILHAHTLVGLWGSMERLVEDIFIESILNDPTLLEHEKLRKLRLPVESILSAAEERAKSILLEYVRSVGSGQRYGVGQFEVLLKPLKLDGEVPDWVSGGVFQAQQIRHLWAHRGGFADTSFAERCGDRAQIGERVLIGRNEFRTLTNAMNTYVLVILNRYFGSIQAKYHDMPVPGHENFWQELGMTNEEPSS